MYEKMTIEEFVKNANPVPDDVFAEEFLPDQWERYMNDARAAYANALIAMRHGMLHAAYWNALDAIGCYAAAHVAHRDDSDVLANSKATHAYLAAIAGAKSEQPHLYLQHAYSKPGLLSSKDAARYKVRPKLRWKDRKMYCGEIFLAEAFHDYPENSRSTFECEDMVFEHYGRNFTRHWATESQKGKTLETVLEEIYTNGIEEIKIKPDGDSWKYELDWCDDVFIDIGDKRQFLFGNAGNLFLDRHFIGHLYANGRNEFCYDPTYFRQQVFMKADGRLLQDGRLIVPAETNPRNVVEAIVQNTLSLLDVELVPR